MFIAADRRSPEEGRLGSNRNEDESPWAGEWAGVSAGQRTAKQIMAR